MPDEIETLAQLIELAELREVVVHELVANRNHVGGIELAGLPPEELHAPDSPDEAGALLRFNIRLEDTELGVRCQVQTCNAYGTFRVDGEAIFALPLPVSPSKPEIVAEFVEQVGAPSVFPYIRAAVASLAAQMSVAASPLPLLNSGEIALVLDEDSVEEEELPDGVLLSGVFSTTTDGGGEPQGEFFVDAQTGAVVRLGGEGQSPELDEALDALAALPPPDELTLEWMIRNQGEEATRELFGAVCADPGDPDAAAVIAMLDAAVARVAAEDTFVELSEALSHLVNEVGAVKEVIGNVPPHGDGDERDALRALLIAAEGVISKWDAL